MITGTGGYIKWKKELGLPARLYYHLSGREPVINIEAFFLGERFAVVIGEHKGRSNARMFDASGYRIIICNGAADFLRQFEAFRNEKLYGTSAGPQSAGQD